MTRWLTAGILLVGSTTAASAQAFRIVFDVHRERSETFEMQSREPATPAPPTATDGPLVLVLGASRLLEVDGDSRRLIDFDLDVVRSIAPDGATFDEYPILAVADDASAELYNRSMQYGALSAAGDLLEEEPELARAFSPFELACLFSLDPPAVKGVEPVAAPGLTDVEGGFQLVHESETVTTVRWSDVRIPEALRATWGRMLQHQLRVHPAVRRRLAQSEVLPAELATRALNMNQLVRERWTLREAGDAEASELELPEGAARSLRVEEAFRGILEAARIAAATPATPVGEGDPLEDYVAGRLAAGKPLDAALAVFEESFVSGIEVSRVLARHRDVLSADPAFGTFISALDMRSEAACRKSLEALDGLDRTGLEKGWVIDIFRANMLAPLGRPEEARTLYVEVLQHNPRLVGVLHDLGWTFVREWQITAGWRCWAAARSLRPDHPLLKDVRDREAELHAEAPDFF